MLFASSPHHRATLSNFHLFHVPPQIDANWSHLLQPKNLSMVLVCAISLRPVAKIISSTSFTLFKLQLIGVIFNTIESPLDILNYLVGNVHLFFLVCLQKSKNLLSPYLLLILIWRPVWCTWTYSEGINQHIRCHRWQKFVSMYVVACIIILMLIIDERWKGKWKKVPRKLWKLNVLYSMMKNNNGMF